MYLSLNREKVRNVAARPGSLIVVLSSSVIWYDYGISPRKAAKSPAVEMSDSQATEVLVDEGVFWIERRAAWSTSDNRKGEALDRVVLRCS
jgi:hypothetical protein